MDAGILMPALVSSMPMPSFAKKCPKDVTNSLMAK
jgi:hypothetical protein